MTRRRRYAIVGMDARAGMLVDAVTGAYREAVDLVGFCDQSQTRMNWHNSRLFQDRGLSTIPTYVSDQFEQMIVETRPGTVIVCTVDATHLLYITGAMELGCDVISE